MSRDRPKGTFTNDRNAGHSYSLVSSLIIAATANHSLQGTTTSRSKSTIPTSSKFPLSQACPANAPRRRSDIMVYFAGSPDGQVKGHDDQAEMIARRGRAFAVDRWRWEDMQSYMLLTILEVRIPMYNPVTMLIFHSINAYFPTTGMRWIYCKSATTCVRDGKECLMIPES